MKEEVLKQICKMIASGEIPKEVYDKYLSKCPIGFMKEEELFRYLTQLEINWEKLKKWLENLKIYYKSMINKYDYSDEDKVVKDILNKMQELESDKHE